jgi:alkane 1-monooxygenase
MKWLLSHRFLFVALVTAVPLPVIGYALGQNWFTLTVALLLLPWADLAIGCDRKNPTPADELRLAQRAAGRAVLYAYVPIQLALIVWGAAVCASGELSTSQALGLLLSVGVVTGGQGITIAHELGHRRSAVDRGLAKLLLTSVCYGHFFIEHNRGHHARVATRDDPATARLGESLYRFLPRAVAGSLASAWQLEAARLRRRDEALLGWHNQMLWFGAVPLLMALALGLAFGATAALFFIGQGVVAFTLLEAINYVEHYGLVRGRSGDGGFERVSAMHSWNASEWLSNACLINLQRHADHHADPSRPYPLLRHRDESPQLPTGYPGMVLVAMVPPLWFRIMNPRVAQLRCGHPDPPAVAQGARGQFDGQGAAVAASPVNVSTRDYGQHAPIRRHCEPLCSPFADDGVTGREF